MTTLIAPPTPSPTILPHSLRHRTRVIMHVDMDCFYAQVERERFPHWRGTPIAVVQNATLAVTSNYRVRLRGLPKTGPPEPMLEGCLALSGTRVNFAGSVMARYRAASKAWYQIFQSFPRIVVMKKSIDESYLDLTEEASHRIRTGQVHRLILQSLEERHRQNEIGQKRFAIAEAKWREEDAQMLAAGVASKDLESTGALPAAQLWSRSTDPITELRSRAKRDRTTSGEPTAGIVTTTTTTQPTNTSQVLTPNPKTKHLEGMTAEQIEEYCNQIHPIDHCRADKRLPPCMLVPANSHIDPSLQLPGVNEAPWRQTFVGYVVLDGTDPKKPPAPDSAISGTPTTAASHTSAATTTAIDDPDDVAPSSSFAHEDPNNPSHDYLMAVGSQIAFEIRSKLFETMGFTTSSGIAPNCMLAKVASSLNKPNQQSVIRSSIAPTFLRDVKLSVISGFGPKACEEVSEHNLVTVGDVQRLSVGTIMKKFDEKFAQYLIDISHGLDDTPVLIHGPPKSIGQSKQQRTSNYEERLALMKWLCEKLMERMIEDEHEYHRRATVLTFNWLVQGAKASVSRRVAMPPYKERRSDGLPLHHEMLEACIKLCKQHIEPNARIPLLAVGASQFRSFQTGKGITGYFSGASASSSTSVNDSFPNQNDVESSTPASTTPSNPLRSFFGVASKTQPSPTQSLTSISSSSESAVDMPDLEVPAVDHSMIEEGAIREKEAREYAATVDEMMDVTNDEHIPDDDEIDALFGNIRSSQPTASTTTAAANNTSLSSSSSSTTGYTMCPTCSQSILNSSFVEHTDFHFAASFQAQLRHQDRLQREKELQSSSSSSDSHSSVNKKKKKADAASSKAGRMSLDRFVVTKSAPSPLAAPPPPSSAIVKPQSSPNKRPSTSTQSTSLTTFFQSK